MKAAVLTSIRHIDFVQLPEPQIQEDDDVKVQIHYVSICADELIGFNDFKRPLGLGHEFSGVVTELGKSAAQMGLSVGDSVTGYTWCFCGKCPYCRRGRENMCINMGHENAMKETIVLKDRQLVRIPDGVPLHLACMFELVASCIHGLDRAGIRTGESLLILGAGGAGLVLLQLARLRGAASITVSDPMESKRLLAKKLGADFVVDPHRENIISRGMVITSSLGYDCIIDASKNRDAVQEAAALLTRGGTLLIFSLYDIKDHVSIGLSSLYAKESTILTSYMAPYMLERAAAALPKLDLASLVGRQYRFNEVQQAYEACNTGRYPRVVVQIAP